MADKGKAALSARELAEEERRARVREQVDRWLAAQPGNGPPFPTDHRDQPRVRFALTRRQTYVHFSGTSQVGPSDQTLRDPDSPDYTPDSPHDSPIYTPASPHDTTIPIPDSPIYTPASPEPEPNVVTRWVTPEHLADYWNRAVRPVTPELGPWYRLRGGYIQFRYGTPWALVDRLEKESAIQRQMARARGEEVAREPPPHQPGEIVLHVLEEPDSPPAPVPAPEDDENDPMEWSESDGSSHGGDEEDLRAWSDTSTVTEDPTMVPSTSRRPIWARRVGARRS